MIDRLLNICQSKEPRCFWTLTPDKHDGVEMYDRAGFDVAHECSHCMAEQSLHSISVDCTRSDSFANRYTYA